MSRKDHFFANDKVPHMNQYISMIGVVATCLAVSTSVEAHSDAACVGYMEADFHYQAAMESAEAIYNNEKAQFDALYVAALDDAKSVRTGALEKSKTIFHNANAKADARYDAVIKAIDSAFQAARKDADATRSKAQLDYQVALEHAEIARTEAIEKAELAYRNLEEEVAVTRDKAIDKIENVFDIAKKHAKDMLLKSRGQATYIRDNSVLKAQDIRNYNLAQANRRFISSLEKFELVFVTKEYKPCAFNAWKYDKSLSQYCDSAFRTMKKFERKKREYAAKPISQRISWWDTYSYRHPQLGYKAANGEYQLALQKSKASYETAVKAAETTFENMLKKSKTAHDVTVKNAGKSRDLAIIKAGNEYDNAMKQPRSVLNKAKTEANASYDALKKKEGAIVRKAEAPITKLMTVRAAAWQAAANVRGNTRGTALSHYVAAKKRIQVAYAASVQEADGDRAVARKRAEIRYGEARKKADTDRWRSYIESYEGATSNVPSIMAKVLNVDRLRCQGKFGK